MLDHWTIGLFFEYIFFIIIALFFALFIYDKYVQRQHQLLINYPVIGRMRYVFEALREPLRQYFSEETFYDSRDKIDWVYKSARNISPFVSFSVGQPFHDSRFIVKHSNLVLNDDEIDDQFSVLFGKNRKKPFRSKSLLARSAMSDGALSPEATRAFSLASNKAGFPLNTGEGGLTSNYFVSHKLPKNHQYLEVIKPNLIDIFYFKIFIFFFNRALAVKIHRRRLLDKKVKNTYIFDQDTHSFFRPNWNADLSHFPKSVPSDIPDLILQIGSGLYGVRDENKNFDPDRYQKVMSFCQMTEIKIAQGAKQTGGKIIGSKVTSDIAYYRGVPEGEDLISPNRFPYASSIDELFDFIGKLQELSQKPVGFKIVISDRDGTDDLIKKIKRRSDKGLSIPDFITVDSGEGGSATAPLELMESVGLNTANALYILDTLLRKYEIRDQLKIIASGKVLTPDDAIINLALGADMIAIARAFMMSGGCIRARHCSGVEGRVCPVGLATQDPKKRASYLVIKQSKKIEHYHNNMLKGIRTMLAVMGLKNTSTLNKDNLAYKNKLGEIYFNVDNYFHQKLHV